MKFGFIAHPTSVGLLRHVKIADMFNRIVADKQHGHANHHWKHTNTVPLAKYSSITSRAGSECQGLLHYMPMLAEQMIKDVRTTSERVIEAVNEFEALGAEIVGLGGFTGIVGERGLKTLKSCKIPVTTGNSLTAFATYRNTIDIVASIDEKIEEKEIAIIGFPGSICQVVSKLLLRLGCKLKLVFRGGEDRKTALLNLIPPEFHGQVSLTKSIEECYEHIDIYIGATSSGKIIKTSRLKPGSIVIDSALPEDVDYDCDERSDIMIIDGGLVSGDDDFLMGCDLMHFTPKKFLNGCFAETIVLSLEKKAEAFSIGRELESSQVLLIGELAEKHGICPNSICVKGEVLKSYQIEAISSIRKPKKYGSSISVENESQIYNDFSKHVNPYLMEFYQQNYIAKIFVKGRKMSLQTVDGEEFLDFVAGYGCINIGHNHPEIKSCINKFLEDQLPCFIQYTSVPAITTQLAKKLVELTPKGLERVFFSNSGTEAVEAALKMAQIARHNKRILYAKNGYHGKTLGALSVTGKSKHRENVSVLDNCTEIEFGSILDLEVEIKKGDVGSVILEPIQGEGGVILPPNGYLKNVEALCKEYDIIFILDEIQTGLGRTGKFLACEWDGVKPDILLLSKSLSGGMLPIAATLSTKKIWDEAYGNADRFLMHTSTFGGGNLASAVALKTLEIIENEKLVAKADELGRYFRAKLDVLNKNIPIIKEIRSKGLMIAIEFQNSFEESIEAMTKEFLPRMPDDILADYKFFPEDIKANLLKVSNRIEEVLEEMFVLKIVTKLSNKFKIITFMTANSNKILRVQPPLIITKDQIDYFVDSLKTTCIDLMTVRES